MRRKKKLTINGVDIQYFTIIYKANDALPAVYNRGREVDEEGNVIDPMWYYGSDCLGDAMRLRDMITATYGAAIPVVSEKETPANYEILLGGVARPEVAYLSELPEPGPMHITMQVRGTKIIVRYGCTMAMRNAGKALRRFFMENPRLSLKDGFTKELSCLDQDSYPRVPGTNLRIVTWNVASTYNWGGYSEIELCHRQNIFLANLRALDPDVLAIQEVDEKWYEVLDTCTDYAQVSPLVPAVDNLPVANLSGLLYKKSKFNEIASGNRPFTTCYDEEGNLTKRANIRAITWAVLEDKETGARALFVNSHWDWKREQVVDPEDGTVYETHQEFHGKLNGQWMHELCEQYGVPGFGMADYNCCEINSKAFAYFLAHGGLENTRTTALREGTLQTNMGTIHTAFMRMIHEPYRAYDQIVYTPCEKVKILGVRTVGENSLVDLSDHVPRYADVVLS